MFSKTIAAALLAVTSAAASAAAQNATPAAQDAPKADEMVCTTERTIGSHLPKRTCMTRAASEERAKRDQETMRNLHGAAKPGSAGQ